MIDKDVGAYICKYIKIDRLLDGYTIVWINKYIRKINGLINSVIKW